MGATEKFYRKWELQGKLHLNSVKISSKHKKRKPGESNTQRMYYLQEMQ